MRIPKNSSTDIKQYLTHEGLLRLVAYLDIRFHINRHLEIEYVFPRKGIMEPIELLILRKNRYGSEILMLSRTERDTCLKLSKIKYKDVLIDEAIPSKRSEYDSIGNFKGKRFPKKLDIQELKDSKNINWEKILEYYI